MTKCIHDNEHDPKDGSICFRCRLEECGVGPFALLTREERHWLWNLLEKSAPVFASEYRLMNDLHDEMVRRGEASPLPYRFGDKAADPRRARADVGSDGLVVVDKS